MFSAKAQIVRKGDVKQSFHQFAEDKVKSLLDKWAEYMYTAEGSARGVTVSQVFIKSWMADFEEKVQVADRQDIDAVKGAIASLMPRYRDAIDEYYNLGSRVFRFAHKATFEESKEQIRPLLAKRGLL